MADQNFINFIDLRLVVLEEIAEKKETKIASYNRDNCARQKLLNIFLDGAHQASTQGVRTKFADSPIALCFTETTLIASN